jgi:hypothetical protein
MVCIWQARVGHKEIESPEKIDMNFERASFCVQGWRCSDAGSAGFMSVVTRV